MGVTVGQIRGLAKKIGRSHELALALWKAEWYEARMLCAFIDEPQRVTPAQMDRWCRDFDNWGICDTLCFALFDRTPHAFDKIMQWSREKGEFQKRASYALLASVALHDKKADDALFAKCLPLIERGAGDDRNFVKKGVSWALRSMGRRGPELRSVCLAMARRLAASEIASERWIGRDAVRDLSRTPKRRSRSSAG